MATFADDTGRNELISTRNVQRASETIYDWPLKWKIKLNEDKSVHVNNTYRRLNNPLNLTINKKVIPYENKAKYLGMTLDTKLKWKEHIKKEKRTT